MPRESRLSEPLPWYPWQPLLWQADRVVQKLSWAERGLLRELQDECYLRRSIPPDLDALADLLAVEPGEIVEFLPKVLRHFKPTEGGRLVSPLIEGIHEKQDEARLKQSFRRLKQPSSNFRPYPGTTADTCGPGEEEIEIENNNKRKKDTPAGYCPEAALPTPGQDDTGLTLPCNGSGPQSWPITPQLLSKWALAFPGVNLQAESQKMRLWLEQNPKKGKTYAGMSRFTLAWLSRSQDQGGSSREGNSMRKRPESDLSAQLEQIDWNGDVNAQ